MSLLSISSTDRRQRYYFGPSRLTTQRIRVKSLDFTIQGGNGLEPIHVGSVVWGSDAYRQGMRPADEILAVNGIPFDQDLSLNKALQVSRLLFATLPEMKTSRHLDSSFVDTEHRTRSSNTSCQSSRWSDVRLDQSSRSTLDIATARRVSFSRGSIALSRTNSKQQFFSIDMQREDLSVGADQCRTRSSTWFGHSWWNGIRVGHLYLGHRSRFSQ